MKKPLVGVLVCAAIGGANACQGNGSVGCNDAECRGAQPEITVTIGQETIHSGSGTHAFGSVLVGQASTDVTVTVANVGDADLVLGAVTLTGAHADQFQVTQASSPVAAGGSSAFKLVFRPSADGAKVATVRLENNDADENPYTFELSGTGVTNMAAGFPVDLQGSTPEEGVATIELSVPIDATAATLRLTVYDAENPDEGTLYINGDAQSLQLFGAESDYGYDARVETLEYDTPVVWWQNGTNSLRFVHTTTSGFRVDSAAVTFKTDSGQPSLTVTTDGSGTVTSSPSGIDCGSTCIASFDLGASVTLTAVPAAGFTFAGWSGDCSGSGACSLSMTASKQVTAQFLPEDATGVIQQVDITPGFETAGIILTLDRDPTGIAITVELKRDTESAYRLQHPPLRYDARHTATSLFYLHPSTRYDVRIQAGQQTLQRTFTTRPEIALPTPLRVVAVANASQFHTALSNAEPGDEIRIAAGTYDGGFVIARSGTVEHPVVITGEIVPSELAKPVYERTGLPLIRNTGGTGFHFNGVAYVFLQNVRIADCGGPGVDLDATRDCVLQDSQIYDNHQDGDMDWSWNVIVHRGGASAGGAIIQGNHVADLSHLNDFSFGYEGKAGVTYYGIRAADHPGPGHIIRRNRVEGFFDCLVPCPDERDDPGPDAMDALAERNQSSHTVQVYDNELQSCRDDAIESDGFCVNAQIFRNRIRKVNNAFSIAPALPGPYFWLRNRITDYYESGVKHNTSSSVLIRGHFFYHNTFAKQRAEGEAALTLWNSGTNSRDLVYRNNIFTSPNKLVDGHEHDPSMDGDLWYSPSLSSSWLDDFRASYGIEANGRWGDPGLSAELEVGAGSPAVDSDLLLPGINHLHSGAGPDIGAFELGGIPQQ